jgi:hypothetical protein
LLGTIDQEAVSEHRRWLRNHMHTWWTGNWNGTDPITPPRVHQLHLHRRRARRQEQERHQPAVDSSDDETYAPAAIQITRSPISRAIRKQTPRVEARHQLIPTRSLGEMTPPRRTDDTHNTTPDRSCAPTRHKRRIQKPRQSGSYRDR